jgi:hypothetical protein
LPAETRHSNLFPHFLHANSYNGITELYYRKRPSWSTCALVFGNSLGMKGGNWEGYASSKADESGGEKYRWSEHKAAS